MIIQLLVDNVNSWFVPYGVSLNKILREMGHKSELLHDHANVRDGDVLLILSCEKIVREHTLNKSKLNLVVHGSDLPEGRGWSPLTWEILAGRSRFCLSLIEASNKVDAGNVIRKSYFELKGTELNDELKSIQGHEIIKIILEFVRAYPDYKAIPQEGVPTYYPRRTATDSLLDVDKTIREQFNLLRVVDNEKYPAFFTMNGEKYILKIERSSNQEKLT